MRRSFRLDQEAACIQSTPLSPPSLLARMLRPFANVLCVKATRAAAAPLLRAFHRTLFCPDKESHRFLPHNDAQRKAMLDRIGVKNVDELFSDVPVHLQVNEYGLPGPQTEAQLMKVFTRMSDTNTVASKVPFFCGAGIYKHYIPAPVDHLIQRSEFLTSYTPYQPEVSQGTLQGMFEFQTGVSMLTGLPVANASMYDGATATSEACMMASRVTRGRRRIVLSGGLHPHYADTIKTVSRHAGATDCMDMPRDLKGDEDLTPHVDENTACVVVQNPSVFGYIRDYSALAEECHKKKALLVVAVTEATSLGLVKSPGDMGADICAAEGQSFGNAMNFGGPTVGLFSTRNDPTFIRQVPGRLVGETVDAEGNRLYCLTIGTREQHIRREKATSNICTSAGLCAMAFTIHLSLLGERGLRSLAELNHTKACELADMITKDVPKVRIMNDTFFNEFTVELPSGTSAREIVDKMADQNILGGVPVSRLFADNTAAEDKHLLVACTESNSSEDMIAFTQALKTLLP